MGAALRDETNVSRAAHIQIRKIAEPDFGIVQAHAIWADQGDLGGNSDFLKLAFKANAQFFGSLRKTRGEKPDCSDFISDAILQNSRGNLTRHRTDGIVY